MISGLCEISIHLGVTYSERTLQFRESHFFAPLRAVKNFNSISASISKETLYRPSVHRNSHIKSNGINEHMIFTFVHNNDGSFDERVLYFNRDSSQFNSSSKLHLTVKSFRTFVLLVFGNLEIFMIM